MTISLSHIDAALAVDVGAKVSYAEMTKVLSAEGQHEVARATYVTTPDNAATRKIVGVRLTKNAQGRAYILLLDSQTESEAKFAFVFAKLKDVSTFDPKDLAMPDASPPLAESALKVLSRGRELGDGLVMIGKGVSKAADGHETSDGTIMVLGNKSPDNYERGIVFHTSNEGQTNRKLAFIEFHYTEK